MKIHSVVLYLKAEVHYISVVVCGNCVVLGSLLLFVKYLCFVCMHDFCVKSELCAMRCFFSFFVSAASVNCVGHHIHSSRSLECSLFFFFMRATNIFFLMTKKY